VSTLSATFSFKEPSRLDSVPQNQTASPETICENVDLVDLGSFRCWCTLLRRSASRAPGLLRKEVIQPQVPLRLPCYDFTPVTDHSLGTSW
jgi:hypothetical protein